MNFDPTHRNMRDDAHSANIWNPELLADFSGETVINLGMPRYWCLFVVRRVAIDRVAAAFSIENTTVPPKVIQNFAPLHNFAALTSTVSGSSSMRSASGEDASAWGIGSGRPSSRWIWATSRSALAIIERASARSKP